VEQVSPALVPPNCPAGETLDGTKGWTTRRFDYGGHLGVTPLLAWRPALRHYGSPNDAS